VFSKIKSFVFFRKTVSAQKVRGTDNSFSKGKEMKTTQKTTNLLLTVLAIAGVLWLLSLATAGDLEPPAPPGPSMHTLDEVYDIYSSMGQVPVFQPAVPKGTNHIYVKFDGIDGEVQDEVYRRWCNVASFKQGHLLPDGGSTGGTRQRGDAVFEDVVLVKPLDKASPKIAEAICKQTHFPKVDIHVTGTFGANETKYYAYELKNALITSYVVGGSGQIDHTPMEQITIAFEEIRVTYTEVSKDGQMKGNVEYQWNTVQSPL
jgi:type VI secretion system Hcp family effector